MTKNLIGRHVIEAVALGTLDAPYRAYTEVQVPLRQRTMEYDNAPVVALFC
jgi:hypothetical protein